jgi:TolB-like protein/predicted ATPase
LQFRFGDHSLDTDRRELRRGGALVALEPQVFDLLVYLVQNRDRVVSKDNLFQSVWGGRIVSESALTSRITAVRKAIGDNGRAQRLIRTMPRKGLRFIGSVEEVEPRATPGHTSAMVSKDPARAGFALPDKPSIAVLPFTNLSGDPDQEHFADGMVEEIITALSRIRWLLVIARNSSFIYKGQAADVKRVGRELGVRYVLEGSVRKAGGRVRIATQLIDALNGAHLWADHFDGSLEDVLGLQEDVAIRVAGIIEPALRAAETHGSAEHPIGNQFESVASDLFSAPSAIRSERRQLTMMICDLVGLAAATSPLDPEDLHDHIAAHRRAVAKVVTRFDGFVARYIGNGVLICFGYPQAHEDNAERALRCALTLTARATKELQVRVGVATGTVVVGHFSGAGGAQHLDVVGEAPNLAAHLQALAEPNSVLIDARTRRLVGNVFEYRDLGAVELTGFAEPVQAYRALRPSAVEDRFEAVHPPPLTPLVGREEEIQLLLRRWHQAKSGDGQLVLLSGEPGIGKSRIASFLLGELQSEPHTELRYFCSPYHTESAFHPTISQLERAARFEREDSVATRSDKLAVLLARTSATKEETALLAELLSLPVAGGDAAVPLTSQKKKERTFDALVRQLETLASAAPVLMVFEDAHWADPSSRELLERIIEVLGYLPVLLVITFRSEYRPPWVGSSHVALMALNRLGRREGTAMVESIARDSALPSTLINEIVARSDGVPLFIEELTKAVLEAGGNEDNAYRMLSTNRGRSAAVPATLQASLMARLDRLGAAARQVAQIGAAIGREFFYALLRAVSRLPEDELQTSLARLVASELVFQRGTPPDAVYAFKHALVQDVAHGSLLRNARQQLHAQIAQALETDSPDLMEAQPELFARHYEEAGLVEKSVAFWGKAGHRSAARSAMAEAAAQFQKGLEQLALLPDDLARRRQEIEFRSSLGTVLQSIKGYAADETGRTLARARELWEQLGSPPEFLQVAYAQSIYHAIRGELKLAHRLDENLLRLSRQRNEPAGLFLAHQSCGRNLMFAGRLVAARSHLEESIALCDLNFDQSVVRQAGLHPKVASQAFLAIILFCLGHPVQALARSNAAIADARRLAHPPSLAMSLTNAARLLSLTGNGAALDEWTGELAKMADEQGFLLWRAAGIIFRGWVRVNAGNVAEGILLLHRGLAAYRATGAEAWVPYQISLLARAYEISGQIEKAADLLDDALHIVARTGERWPEAELYRHRGQLLLRQGRSETAEELYRKALGIAREQAAKLWELRAAVSLAGLRRDQGRNTEARDLLAPVYDWFTEGFDTPDLRKARALLDELV